MHDAIVVLADGETFSEIKGAIIVDIPEGIVKSESTATEDVEEFLKEGDFDSTDIRELINVCEEICSNADKTPAEFFHDTIKAGLINKLRGILNLKTNGS